MPAPVIRRIGGDERMSRTTYPVLVAQEIREGWLVRSNGGNCEPVSDAAHDDTFAGIAFTSHVPNFDNRDTISVVEECEVEVDVDTADYTRGQELQFSAGTGNTIVLIDDAAAGNTVAWAAETKTNTDRLLVRISVWQLQKLLGQVA